MAWCHFARLIELAQAPADKNHCLDVTEHPNKLFLVELKGCQGSAKLLPFLQIPIQWQMFKSKLVYIWFKGN
jgi:hypothetical protein